MTQQITLKSGGFTLVDDADFEWLSQDSWHKANGYPLRRTGGNRDYMHRLIMAAKPGEYVDHINRDKTDNRRENLRICSNAQNGMNCTKRTTPSSSQYKGVSWDKRRQRWEVRIGNNYRMIYLGSYTNEIDAARAYNEAAKQHFGEFAWLNPVD